MLGGSSDGLELYGKYKNIFIIVEFGPPIPRPVT